MVTRSSPSVKLIYCYARKDRILRDQLDGHLAVLRRLNLITTWYDGEIIAGTAWEVEVKVQLSTADVILLLVSSDFIASDYCYSIEMVQALERHRAKEVRVVPILLRPVDWTMTPFHELQMIPTDARPITSWADRDEGWADVTKHVRRVVVDLIEQRATAGQQSTSPITPPQKATRDRNEQRLINHMRKRWIKGVLKQSLYHDLSLPLEFVAHPEAVMRTTQEGGSAGATYQARHLPATTQINQIPDDYAESRLLILGQPGAGKTTLLLMLARERLAKIESREHAQQANIYALPVFLHLSSWTKKRLPLKTWVIEELYRLYHIARQTGGDWVTQERLLLLFDGFDELPLEARNACIMKINTYLEEFELAEVVLASRSETYQNLETPVMLNTAIEIQPLTTQQVQDYCSNAGEDLVTIQTALRDDESLQELATTPLMLNILIQAYQGRTVDDLSTLPSLEARRHFLLEHYVARALETWQSTSRYTHGQIQHWLTWLAQQMKRSHHSEFYIEQIQAQWLPNTFLYQLQHGLVNGLTYGILIATAHGAIYSIAWWLLPDTFSILVLILFTFLIWSMGLGLLSLLSSGNKQKILQQPSSKLPTLLELLQNRSFVLTGLVVGLLNGLQIGWLFNLKSGETLAISYGLLFSIVFAGCYITLGPIQREIRPTDVFAWSWRGMLLYAGMALVAGVAISVLYQWMQINFSVAQTRDLPIIPLLTTVITIIGGLVGGLAGKKSEPKEFIWPNQGIRDSLYNSIITGILAGLVIGLCVGFTATLIVQHEQGVSYPALWSIYFGFACGVISTLFVSLRNGGVACLQHLLLRLFLWHSKKMPLRYEAFLDEVARNRLLQKVGGGYIFFHRLLLDYLDSLEPSPASQTPYDASPDETPLLRNQTEFSTTSHERSAEPQRLSPSLTTKKKKRAGRYTLVLTIILLFTIVAIITLPPTFNQYMADKERRATATSIAQLPNPYITNTGSTLAYYDPLSHPYLWQNTLYDDNSEECTFANSVYRVHAKASTSSTFCEARDNDNPLVLHNFVFEVQMQLLLPQSCGGLRFRIDPQEVSGYGSIICQDNRRVEFARETQAKWGRLNPTAHTDTPLDPTQFHTIAIVASKDLLQIYVNRKEILRLSDSTYQSGFIQLVAGSSNGQADVLYKNAKIWKLAS